jgi:putative ABC transport system permease protein
MVSASIMAAMLSVSLDIDRKFSRELRSYGANLLVLPRGNVASPVGIGGLELALASGYSSYGNSYGYIDANALRQLEKWRVSGKISEYVPYLYGLVSAQNRPVVLVGTHFDHLIRLSPWWKIKGRWISERSDETSCIAGSLVSKTLGWNVGTTVTLQYKGRSHVFRVVGIVSTGASEDHQIFANLSSVERILGLSNQISLALARADGTHNQVETTSKFIQSQIPDVEARILRQITESDKKILERVQRMIFLTSAIILIISSLCLMTTMMDLVIERQQEIGIMKAIGAENGKIASLFLGEAGILGLIGGALGYSLGFLLAQLIGHSVFDTAISMRAAVIPVVVAISITLTVISSILPARRAMEIEPIIALRGE